MSTNESDSCVNSSESSSKIDTRSDGDTSTSGSEYHVASHNFAYDDEPLAEPGQDVEISLTTQTEYHHQYWKREATAECL
jgi:hypothetical protein